MLVKADNGAVGVAPFAGEHGSSFSDGGLAGVGFRSADQNADTSGGEEKHSLITSGGTQQI